MKKNRGPDALLVLLCCWPADAVAEAFRVAVLCPGLSGEQVSQVEARIRAAVLLDEAPPREVQVRCEEPSVTISVQGGLGNVERAVTRTTAILEDDIVREVDLALRELRGVAASASVSVPSEPPPTAPPPAPAPAAEPLRPARPLPVTPSSATPSPPSWLELRGSAVLERWSDNWTLGAEAAPSLGDGTLRYGVALGGAWALAEAGEFEVNEVHAAVELTVRPRFAFGFGASAAAGASLLSVTPDGGLSTTKPTAYSAAFFQLVVSKPLWIGAFAVAPELGLRGHLAERNVLVDGDERLVLPELMPLARLSIIWSRRP